MKTQPIKKSEAITQHVNGNWDKFAVMVWKEGDNFVTEVDGHIVVATSEIEVNAKLDAISAPSPRILYFVDQPNYETSL
jgi:hypothetical protein